MQDRSVACSQNKSYYSKWCSEAIKTQRLFSENCKWVAIFKIEPSQICGRQPLKNSKWSA